MSRHSSAYRPTHSCDGGNSAPPPPVVNSYDPQIGAAAQQETALAAQQQAWTQNYYNQYVTPALTQQQKLSADDEARLQDLSKTEIASMQDNQKQQDQVYALDYPLAQAAANEYTTQGLPAEDAYYKMVQDYSAPQYQEQQATGAIGDVRSAAASSQGALQRSMAAAGVNPSSPAAMSAMADMAVQTSAAQATAATRARTAAQQLGMSLKSDAANYARGDASTAMGFGSGATSAGAAGAGGSASTGSVAGSALSSSGALGISGVSAANSGASVPMAGFAGAQNAYGANMNAWSGLGSSSMQANSAIQKAQMEANAQSQAGLGGFLGSAFGSIMTKVPMMSDRRLKVNISHVGHITVEQQPLKVYNFAYRWDPATTHLGVMADEVLKVKPSAVSYDQDGYAMVDYRQLGA